MSITLLTRDCQGFSVSSLRGKVVAADIEAVLARFRSTMKTPLPPAARTRSPINTIQNTVIPWLEVGSVGWPPEVVPPFAMVVLEEAAVREDAGVLVSRQYFMVYQGIPPISLCFQQHEATY
ncbi:MAG TPA: hypothetical protein VFU32_13445, partial [Ktedonobacterales bacterium]|nr:hypothetical protein [Ktedonobacterales bacterium]